MNQLVKEITKGLLEQEKKTVAVYGGGFKPPTKGHFEVVKQSLDENPEIDEYIIYVGKKDREGVTQEDSMKIWGIYRNYLPNKVKIREATKPPIQEIYNIAKNNPQDEILWIIGAREENEADFADIASRTKSITKYPNLELRTIVTKGGVSGTAARNASKVSPEKLNQYLPDFLSVQEKNNIFVILSNKVSEIQSLNEHASYTDSIDIVEKIAELTQHMIDKGMNIEPLPTMEFIDGDSENAKDFLGKTAYYDPDAKHIVLYTEGRHPKDIVRSYAHEMIHHIQNLEGRLGNITTTNTTEDDHLTKLEQEANLRGTMTFRGWTDSIKEQKTKDPFGINAYAAELGRLREEEQDYKIYLDMDGVVADFDQRFRDLSGMGPRDFESKHGKNAFWDFIDEKHKVGFWVGIPPMEGASQLVDYVSKHDYVMLTAPSVKKQSRLGKALWIRNHTGDIFPSKPTVIFKAAKEKHKVKPSLTEKDILIDDKASTIDNWNAAGGTGILYTSANQAISELKKLGL
jgi:PAS domain-containing protein